MSLFAKIDTFEVSKLGLTLPRELFSIIRDYVFPDFDEIDADKWELDYLHYAFKEGRPDYNAIWNKNQVEIKEEVTNFISDFKKNPNDNLLRLKIGKFVNFYEYYSFVFYFLPIDNMIELMFISKTYNYFIADALEGSMNDIIIDFGNSESINRYNQLAEMLFSLILENDDYMVIIPLFDLSSTSKKTPSNNTALQYLNTQFKLINSDLDKTDYDTIIKYNKMVDKYEDNLRKKYYDSPPPPKIDIRE